MPFLLPDRSFGSDYVLQPNDVLEIVSANDDRVIVRRIGGIALVNEGRRYFHPIGVNQDNEMPGIVSRSMKPGLEARMRLGAEDTPSLVNWRRLTYSTRRQFDAASEDEADAG